MFVIKYLKNEIFLIFQLKYSPADGPPVDDPAQLRLAAAAGPGGVRSPGVGRAHLHHPLPPQQGQLRPQPAAMESVSTSY